MVRKTRRQSGGTSRQRKKHEGDLGKRRGVQVEDERQKKKEE